MSIPLGTLQSEQQEAVKMLKDLGEVYRLLEVHELVKFGRSFERQFVMQTYNREIADIYNRHRTEILCGAMMAKAQMESELDGETPSSNKIGGPLMSRACWFGIGEDWEDISGIYAEAQSTWSTGSAQNWIHSGTSLMAGTAGNAIKILENAVHIVFGVVELGTVPKVETSRFTLDGKTKPVHIWNQQKIAPSHLNFKIKEFDNTVILKKNSTFLAQLFISRAIGGRSSYQQSFPRLLSASFIKEDQLRTFAPTTANMVGTGPNIVTTT